MWILVLILLFVCFVGYNKPSRKASELSAEKKTSLITYVVLGSGGHTGEMLELMKQLSPESYAPRYYFLADNDQLSERKAIEFEQSHKQDSFKIVRIPRSRQVMQSYVSSVLSTLRATLHFILFMFRENKIPELLICNGPGTCVPVCVVLKCMKMFGFKTRLIYVESIARVQTLSLSGKLLYKIVDDFFVQWPSLHARYPKSIYLGRLV